jgi:hypothetical protein
MMLVVIPITIAIFALFLVKALVRKTWQKKFTAAVFLLVGSLSVLYRFVIAYKQNINCKATNIVSSLIVQSIF